MIRIDARGLRCPWPALRAARALRTASAIEIEADDPAAPRELAALATAQGLAFEALSGGCFRISQAAG
jgi:tRNA 2-thiouridine synthesizing protein A